MIDKIGNLRWHNKFREGYKLYSIKTIQIFSLFPRKIFQIIYNLSSVEYSYRNETSNDWRTAVIILRYPINLIRSQNLKRLNSGTYPNIALLRYIFSLNTGDKISLDNQPQFLIWTIWIWLTAATITIEVE